MAMFLAVLSAWALAFIGIIAFGLVILTVSDWVLDKLAGRYGDEQ